MNDMPDAPQEVLDQLGSPRNFAHEWTSFPSIVPEYESQFEGWVSALDRGDFVEAYVVDAGCGTGRNTFWSLKWGARRVFAFDVDESTVEVARRNLEPFSTAEVACASIYRVELPDTEVPDIVMSIGVIHHLADPKLAVRQLVQLVREGGTVLLWVYGSEGNERLLRVLIPLRAACAKIPINTLKKLSAILTLPIFIYVRTPFPKSTYLQHVARFKFWHLHSIIFDQLFPLIAHYWSHDEVRALLRDSGLENIGITRVNGMSWSASGQKPLRDRADWR